eukprot:4204000-Lingulodinium_polyedra.AAC.1
MHAQRVRVQPPLPLQLVHGLQVLNEGLPGQRVHPLRDLPPRLQVVPNPLALEPARRLESQPVLRR